MTNRTTFTIPATLDAVARRKDRSISIRASSTLELSPEDLMEIDRITPSNGWLMFSQNQIDEGAIPTDDSPSDIKSMAQELRTEIWINWKELEKEESDFQTFYRKTMRRYIATERGKRE